MLSFAMLPSLDIFHKGNEHAGHRTLKYISMASEESRQKHAEPTTSATTSSTFCSCVSCVRMANRKANPKYLWSAARCGARKRCWEKGAKIERGLPGQGGKTSRPGVACTGAKSWKTYLKLGRLHFILCVCPPNCFLFYFVPECQIQRQ